MPLSEKKVALSKFPLRLMPYVRKGAVEFSERQGVSLNQFINVAVAEKLAHLEHEEWVASRSKPTKARISRALAVLDKPTRNAPDPDDRMPPGYRSFRRTNENKLLKGRK